MFCFPKSLLFCGILFLTFAFSARAQIVKIGVVDRYYITSALQANGSVQLEQQKTEMRLRKEIESLNRALEEKQRLALEYKKQGNQTSSEKAEKDSQQQLSSMETKRKELQSLKSETSQSNAQLIQAAIKAVALEKGYTSILEVNAVPFYQDSDNISALVLQKLGIIE